MATGGLRGHIARNDLRPALEHHPDDLLEWFRGQVHSAGGGNYQTLVNDALRTFVQERRKPIEAVLRRVVREELKRAHGER